MANDNKSLGRFILDGIPPAPRGMPKIEVTFDIDANGILNVTAKDQATGKEQKITITGSSGLSEDEVQRMVNEAETHADEDKQRREVITTRNEAESLVFQAEKTLEEYGDKVPSEKKADLENKIQQMKDVLENDRENAERIKTGHQELMAALSAVGQSMYEAAGADGAGAEGTEGFTANGETAGAGATTDEDEATVEGEFREVPDDK
jgi:molecular chaperone DnaK